MQVESFPNHIQQFVQNTEVVQLKGPKGILCLIRGPYGAVPCRRVNRKAIHYVKFLEDLAMLLK